MNDLQRYAQKIRCFIRFADDLRFLATDPTFQCGCVIFPLDCSRVLSIGYNGAPAGFPHERPEVPHNSAGGSGMCHAELNALTKMDAVSAPKCLLFVHTTPCMRCAGQIINARKIVGVIHEDRYYGDEGAGLDWLNKADHVHTLHRVVIEQLAEEKMERHALVNSWRLQRDD